jgi:hypothetical protein
LSATEALLTRFEPSGFPFTITSWHVPPAQRENVSEKDSVDPFPRVYCFGPKVVAVCAALEETNDNAAKIIKSSMRNDLFRMAYSLKGIYTSDPSQCGALRFRQLCNYSKCE